MKTGHRILLAAAFFAGSLAVVDDVVGQHEKSPQKAEKPRPAVVEGRITFPAKKIPKARVRDDTGALRDLLVVDRKSRGVKYVLVYLQPDTGEAKPKSAVDSHAGKKGKRSPAVKPPTIDQAEHRFVPHLLAIGDGQRVKFTNADAANHNVRAVSLQEANNFNVFTAAGGGYEHTFVADKKSRPIRLTCDIHPWMSAWIYVFRHPFYAVSGKKGEFRIESVPPGKYQLVVRQPDVGYLHTRSLSLKTGEKATVELSIKEMDIKTR